MTAAWACVLPCPRQCLLSLSEPDATAVSAEQKLPQIAADCTGQEACQYTPCRRDTPPHQSCQPGKRRQRLGPDQQGQHIQTNGIDHRQQG